MYDKKFLDKISNLDITEHLDALPAYCKKTIDGDYTYYNFNINGHDKNIAINKNLWNDIKNKKKKEDKPRRGIISLYQHLFKCSFLIAVKEIEKYLQIYNI